MTRDMVMAYCAQWAYLRGYHRMLTNRREASPQLDMASTMDRFLAAMNKLEEDRKAVLGILAAALDAAPRA